MDEINFQLPVASYEIVVRIIEGYYHAGAGNEAVSLASVADSTAMKRPNISANNKFLLSMGILERTGNGYQLTPAGSRLAQVLDYYKETASPEVQSAWKDIVDKNDFLQRVTAAVRVRGKMDVEAFARHIALTSGAPNKPQVMTGARTVITILQLANKVIEGEDGTLKATGTEPVSPTIESRMATSNDEETPYRLPQEAPSLLSVATVPITVMVQITPQTTDDDLEDLARKIKYLSELVNSKGSTRE
jgi:hypothetical protein